MRDIEYVLEREYGVNLPRRFQLEFSRMVQALIDTNCAALSSEQVFALFKREYLGEDSVYVYGAHQLSPKGEDQNVDCLMLRVKYRGQGAVLSGEGRGPVEAIIDALGLGFGVLSHEQRSLVDAAGASRAMAFVEIMTPARMALFGVGMHENRVAASLQAVLSAVNRALIRGLLDDSMSVAADGELGKPCGSS